MIKVLLRYSFFVLLIFLIRVGILSQAGAISIDSTFIDVERMSLPEQFHFIEQMPFDLIVSNNQSIIPFLLKYEKLAIAHKRTTTLAKIYINLSLANYYKGKYDENIRYGLKAISLYDSLGDKWKLGTMYGELGYQMKRRDLPKAFELMQKGIKVLEDLGEAEPLAKIYDNYGVLHEMNNVTDSAFYFYRKALSIKKIMNDSLGIPFSLNNLFSLYMMRRNYDSALWYLNESTRIRTKRNDALGMAENYSYYGQLYSSLGNHSKSIEYNQKAIEIAKKHGYTFLMQSLFHDLSVSYEKQMNYDKALKYFKLYKQFQDSLINIETNKTIANLQVQFETAEKEKELVVKNQQLEREKSTKIYFAVISIILIISTFLFFRNKLLIAQRNERISVQNALIEGEQTERNRLALELHDGIANDLSAVILSLSNSKETSENGLKGIEKLRETHQSVRKLSHTLMPRSLREKGLSEALRELSSNFGTEQLSIEVQVLGMEKRVDNFLEFNIYRIVQEALNNILKHSQATRVLIECNRVVDTLLVNVEDNGVGFVNDETKREGLGLQNISNRVKMMNGNLNIRTAPNEGTVVEINVPIG